MACSPLRRGLGIQCVVVVWALMVCACGASPARGQPEGRRVKKVDPAVSQRVEALEEELRQAQARLRNEHSQALPPPRPPGLKPGDGLRLDLSARMQVIDQPGARPYARSLAEYLGGQRGAVFSLWATWCKPCIADEELVLLRRLQQALPSDFPLISMACDGLDKVLAHEKATRWIHPVWQLDDGHLAVLPQAFIQRYGLGLPVFLIVRSDGEVRWLRTQALDDQAVAEILAATREPLAGPNPSP